MKLVFYRAGFVFVFFMTGFSFILKSNGRYQTSNVRDPAAIRQVYDFSQLQGSALETAMRERAIQGLQVDQRDDRLGVGIGHFAFTNAAGEKTLACREYNNISLKFEAEGVSVDGEKPSMEVEGACEFSEDLTMTTPLYIPVARILGEKPADGEFQFREGKQVTVRFANLSDQWPHEWVLTDMTMHGTRGDFDVNRNDLNHYLGHPFMIHLQQ